VGDFVAFDIETAKLDDWASGDWRRHRPLGITCIASLTTACDKPRVWTTKTSPETYAPQMAKEDVATFVTYLEEQAGQGFVPLTWNGLSFDFEVLGEESGRERACRELAADHVDMMFHFFCEKGFFVSLDKVAAGMGISGKTKGMSGKQAPRLWAEGKYDAVLEYVSQDVRATMDVALAAERQRGISWITQRGKASRLNLPSGWMTVEQAKALPLPDTSWMPDPVDRESFLKWLDS